MAAEPMPLEREGNRTAHWRIPRAFPDGAAEPAQAGPQVRDPLGKQAPNTAVAMVVAGRARKSRALVTAIALGAAGAAVRKSRALVVAVVLEAAVAVRRPHAPQQQHAHVLRFGHLEQEVRWPAGIFSNNTLEI